MNQQIISAAKTCFKRYGIDNTCIEDILAEAGVSSEQYPNLKSKYEIFITSAVDDAANFVSALAKKVETNYETLPEQIINYLHMRRAYYLQELSQNKFSKITVHRILPHFIKAYEEVLVQEVAFIASLLHKAYKQGKIKKINTREFALSILTINDALSYYEQSADLAAIQQSPEVKDTLTCIINLALSGITINNNANLN